MRFFIECESVNQNLIKYKCLSCNKSYSNKTDEELKDLFKNTFNFFGNDINKLIFLLKRCLFFWIHGWLGKV